MTPFLCLFFGDPFSLADGRRVAYRAQNGGGWMVIVDGKVNGISDCIMDSDGTPVFSADSKHIAFEINKNGKQLVMMDGQPGKEYDSVCKGAPFFRPGGVMDYLAIRDHSLFRVRCVPTQ